jgi:tetratricopeptide (TPR) repeat protein
LILLGILLALSCSEKSPSDPNGGNGNGGQNTPSRWTEIGWELYETGEFEDARSAFANAVLLDSTYAPAVSGLGWCDLEFGWSGLSYREFEEAIFLDSTLVESYYGGAFMAHTQALGSPGRRAEYLQAAVDHGESGLEMGGDSYQFEHNQAVTAVSLRVLLAAAYFDLARYDRAQEIVELLNPNTELDPRSPSYLQELLLAIENLGGLL